MKKLYPKNWFFKLSLMIIALCGIIYGCRKDKPGPTSPVTDPKIAAAKSWYEGAYPVNKTGQTLQTNSSERADLSQIVKPDWQHPANYNRFDEDVIELPIDPGSKFGVVLRTDKADQTSITHAIISCC